MKSFKAILFSLMFFLVVPGCLFKKDGVEVDKKMNKKVALLDKGRGIPLSDLKDEGKFFDSGVESFVLDEDELGSEIVSFDAEKEMLLARADIEQDEPSWKEDAAIEKEYFEAIHFDFDGHVVRDDQQATLAFDIQQAQKIDQESAITITGHSDSHFVSEIYNIAKSEKRAHEVANHLEQAGIPKERIKVVGYGDKQRVIDSSGKEEKNRRVEIVKLAKIA